MLMPCEQYSPYGIYVPGYSRRVTGEPRRYRYVGPADVLATVRRGGEGRFSSLAGTFAAAARLEADFWQMGLEAKS